MIESTRLSTTWISTKNRVLSNISMFFCFALLGLGIGMLLISQQVTLYGINSTAMDLFLNASPYALNLFASFLVYAAGGMAIFTLFYCIRNTQHNDLSMSVNRTSHYFSNLIAGIFFSLLMTILAVIAELIIRSAFQNSENFVIYTNYIKDSVKYIFMAMPFVFVVSWLSFVGISSIINSIMRKKFFGILIPIAIAIVVAVVVALLHTLPFINFAFKWYGIMGICGVTALFIEIYNYCITTQGGIRR